MHKLWVIALLVGCTRDPVDAECPDVAVGDLAITEIRGPQDQDGLGTWIELYNASSTSIDLEGLKVRFRKKDGSSETDVIVRRSLPVAAGEYATLGLFDDDTTRPSYIDYGMNGDFHTSFLPAAAVDLEACGIRIDRATYDVLPDMGTYSLGGVPSADNNDLPTSWCTDATNMAGMYPGTPREANITCP
ncbi:MAG: lamin tail domain-containing protein [Kofleriaceae bacterium]